VKRLNIKAEERTQNKCEISEINTHLIPIDDLEVVFQMSCQVNLQRLKIQPSIKEIFINWNKKD
jgi:hypothetical protein